ncbi:DUF4375 domain-containing protein [Bremerella sp.]|uniref:DMP19 family protein n=1 Tax=Bremerella sp. TaxID=2795602 RepID=UPI0039191E94
MALNDLKKPLRNHRYYKLKFRDRRDAQRSIGGMWNPFFFHTCRGDPWPDLAIWEIGSEIRLRPASTELDEAHPRFQRPPEIAYLVTGYETERNRIERRKGSDAATIATELEQLQAELRELIEPLIVQSFLLKGMQKLFTEWNPDQRPFTILATDADNGLPHSQWRLLWKSDNGRSLKQIKTRVQKAQGKSPIEAEAKPSQWQLYQEKRKASKQRERKQHEQVRRQIADAVEKRKPAIRRKLADLPSSNARPTKKATDYPAAKRFLVSLDDGNQHDRILSTKLPVESLVAIQARYLWSSFDEDDNRLWEYRYALLDPVLKKSRLSFPRLWARLNRPQKTFYAFLAFDGDVNNGGVWQFLFNCPQLSLAAWEAMDQIGAKKLAANYQETLAELAGQAETIADLRRHFEDQNLSTTKRWAAFVQGYDTVPSAKKIEQTYFTAKFKRPLYQSMAKYVEANLNAFAEWTD